MLAFAALGVVVTVGLLGLGPVLSVWIGHVVGGVGIVCAMWWGLARPFVLGALALVFAALLTLGPSVDPRRWQLASTGAFVAVALWVVVSLLFALYVSRFGAFNRTWGSLSAAIVTVVWIWLSALALLLGAEVDAELERLRSISHDPGVSPRSPAPVSGHRVDVGRRAGRASSRDGLGARARRRDRCEDTREVENAPHVLRIGYDEDDGPPAA
jgi:membrane protein